MEDKTKIYEFYSFDEKELALNLPATKITVNRCRFRLNFIDCCAAKKQFPLVIQNMGDVSLYINHHELIVSAKRILQHDDVIGLDPKYIFYKVSYFNTKKLGSSSSKLHEKYFIGDELGKGGFGTVHVCYETTKGLEVGDFSKFALKIINGADQKTMREVEAMKKLDHEYIMKIIDYEHNQTSKELFIVLPLMDGGTLSDLIKSEKRLSELDAQYYFYQLMHGLEYLHGKKFVHRDIKGENLLLSKGNLSNTLKISDFGLSKILETYNTQCGTKVSLNSFLKSNIN